MRVEGRILKSGGWWAIEVGVLDVYTQGRTRKEAFAMLKDAVQALADNGELELEIHPQRGERFELGSRDDGVLCALVLKRQRQAQGLTLSDISERLQKKSKNAYARYEQGRSTPTVHKFVELLKAVNPAVEFVVTER